jgi:hypothetical protein
VRPPADQAADAGTGQPTADDPSSADGDGGSAAHSAAAGPSTGSGLKADLVASLRAEAIDRFLKIAADKSFTPAERLQEIDALAPAFDDRLGEDDLRQIVRTAIDVAENRIKPAEARKHLEMMP